MNTRIQISNAKFIYSFFTLNNKVSIQKEILYSEQSIETIRKILQNKLDEWKNTDALPFVTNYRTD